MAVVAATFRKVTRERREVIEGPFECWAAPRQEYKSFLLGAAPEPAKNQTRVKNFNEFEYVLGEQCHDAT